MVKNAVMNFSEEQAIEWLSQHQASDISAFSIDKIEEIHQIAFHLYYDKQYAQAAHFFRLLTVINPLDAKYWKGLGASLQLNKNYEQAIPNYVNAAALTTKPDPYLYVYTADCYFALNQINKGLKALEGAKTYAQNNKQVLNHVAFMQELWANK